MTPLTTSATPAPLTNVVRSPFDLLEVVDALPNDASGEVVLRDVGGAIVGILFVESRRICWIAARGLSRRLSDLLRARTRPPLDAAAMEELYGRCRREGTRLGESLVSAGLLGADDLRAALLQHSTECLHALGDVRVSARFSPRAGAGYAPDFTFTTGELATATGALAYGRGIDAPLRALTMVEPEWGASYARHSTHSHPLPLLSVGEPVSSRMLLGVGRWASEVLDLAGALDEPHRFTSVAEHRGGAVLWCDEGILHVACYAEQGRFSRAISRRVSAGSS